MVLGVVLILFLGLAGAGAATAAALQSRFAATDLAAPQSRGRDLSLVVWSTTVGAVIGGGDEPPPARIVLLSDGKETVPSNPDNPKGAYTAARTAKDQGVPISTVSFGTPYGYVEINDQRQPVPVPLSTRMVDRGRDLCPPKS
jgi:secreted protein with Ig-like and vWFA domain